LKNACNQNINFEIEQAKNFSEYLHFYQKLTDDETIYKKDIDEFENKRALNYAIFYGEKFGLHFGQFVSKNIDDLNNNDDSSLDGDIIDQIIFMKNIIK
jgi:lantibiotic modifying enzyme